MNKELELIKRLYIAIKKLDMDYCTMLNEEDFTLGMTGKEYEEIDDLINEVGEYLGEE